MMSDLILPFHSDLHTVILILVSFYFLFFPFVHFVVCFSVFVLIFFNHISEPKLCHLFIQFSPIPHTTMMISQVNYANENSHHRYFLFCFVFRQLHQSIRMQHLSTNTQLARAYDSLNLDGYVSPCHPHIVAQVQYIYSIYIENVTAFSFNLQKIKLSFIKHCFANFHLCFHFCFIGWFGFL